MTPRFVSACVLALSLVALPGSAFAQRELHWDSVDVTAHLDADGRLLVKETQTIVFNGDWNGGERRFNIRPRQQFEMISLDRAEGDGWKPMVLDSTLNDVDDYGFTNDTTLRWRSRLPSDPPFAGKSITYALVYQLSNIILKKGDGYTLNHDFLFPDRQGVISRASVVLTFDPAWQPQASVQSRYTAEQIPAGRGLVLTIPLRHAGATLPMVLDTSLPRGIVRGLWSLLLIPIVVISWAFARERSYGRFAPLETTIDEPWIREHVLRYPAEVVAAAWDNHVESDEVVALLARLVAEGKLKSSATKGSMSLSLLVNRGKFDGYERELIDALFFGNSSHTSTEMVQRRYKKKGFDPTELIRAKLTARAAEILPPGRAPWSVPFLATAVYAVGALLTVREWMSGRITTTIAALFIIGVLPVILWVRREGLRFRANIQWGPRQAWSSILPGVAAMAVGAVYLWRWANSGEVPVSDGFAIGIVMLTLSVLLAGVGGMKSTQHRAALAFRKKLAAGREFFAAELAKDQPALRDEWFPWVLAFGLNRQMDAWSAEREPTSSTSSSDSRSSSGSFRSGESSGSSSAAWTGFGGGRSGGGGGSASWGAAAAGLAAPIAAPSSSSSSGDSGGSSSGGDSGGGSSGGGGGGGW